MVEHCCINFKPKSNYGEVLDHYIKYVKSKYEKYKSINAVFDGYSDTISTKVQEHHRAGQPQHRNQGQHKVTFTREALSGNTNNKDELIKLLYARILKKGFSAIQCKGEADVSIVKYGIGFAECGRNVAVVAENNDVLISLLKMYHLKVGMEELIFGTERKGKKTKIN